MSCFKIALTALAVGLGMHQLRVLLPTVIWYLKDTLALPTPGLIPFGLGPFVAGVLVLPLRYLVGWRQALWISGSILAAARVSEQILRQPAWDLWAAMAGFVAFLWLLPLLWSLGQRPFAFGLLLGLAGDTALKGATRTLDLSWIAEPWSVAVAIALAVLLVVSLCFCAASDPPEHPVGWREGALLLGLGPLLLFEVILLQNQGLLSALTGWSQAGALLALTLANLVSVEIALRIPAAPRLVAAAAGACFLFSVAAVETPGAAGALAVFAGLAGGGLYLGLLATLRSSTRSRAVAAGLPLAASAVAWGLLVLLYFVAQDVDLPISRRQVAYVDAAILVVCTMAAAWGRGPSGPHSPRDPRARGLRTVIAALIAVPLAQLVFEPPPAPVPGNEGTLRVMTYNIHFGFDADGRHDLEAIARSIESAGASVIGLQEVPRGSLMAGNTDVAGWLQHRLEMPYLVYGPTRDPVWGNLILSRFPLSRVYREHLPSLGSLLDRSFVEASVDLGSSEPLIFVTTHLQHRGADLEAIQAAQLQPILNRWNGRQRTVLVGDLNAEPGSTSVETVLAAGFRDSWGRGHGAGFTFSSDRPRRRIDWIFHSPDLVGLGTEVKYGRASDHLPVVATFVVGGR